MPGTGILYVSTCLCHCYAVSSTKTAAFCRTMQGQRTGSSSFVLVSQTLVQTAQYRAMPLLCSGGVLTEGMLLRRKYAIARTQAKLLCDAQY
eukprot:3063414-Rhodomonas_salina.3